MRSVRNPYTPTTQLRIASACRIKLPVRAQLVNMTATALLSVAFGTSCKAQGTSSYAPIPCSEPRGLRTAYQPLTVRIALLEALSKGALQGDHT